MSAVCVFKSHLDLLPRRLALAFLKTVATLKIQIDSAPVTPGIRHGVILRFPQHSITFHRCYSARYMRVKGFYCPTRAANRALCQTILDSEPNSRRWMGGREYF